MTFKHNFTYKVIVFGIPIILLIASVGTAIFVAAPWIIIGIIKCCYDRIYIDESVVSIKYLSIRGFINESWSLRRVREVKRRSIGFGFNEILIQGTYNTSYLMACVKRSKQLVRYYESLL